MEGKKGGEKEEERKMFGKRGERERERGRERERETLNRKKRGKSQGTIGKGGGRKTESTVFANHTLKPKTFLETNHVPEEIPGLSA